MECVWVGWPGTYVDPGRQSSLTDQLKDRRLVPIFLVRDNARAEKAKGRNRREKTEGAHQ